MTFTVPGDTLYNVEEGDFLFQATNTYGCTSTWTWAFAFPGVQDLQRAIDWTWLSPTTVELSAPVERVALHNALGQVVWQQRLSGARRAELPLAEGDGWRLIRLELVGENSNSAGCATAWFSRDIHPKHTKRATQMGSPFAIAFVEFMRAM